MDSKPIFSRGELAELRSAAREGRRLYCPRCAVELTTHRISRPPEVSYVRRRTWYLCPSCHRSAVVDDAAR